MGCASTVMAGTTAHTGQGYLRVLTGARVYCTASGGGRQRRSTGWVLPRYRSGTRVHGCSGRPRAARAVRCAQVQVRTCPVFRAATSVRRAPRGSRPRRSAGPRPPPRARERLRLSWRHRTDIRRAAISGRLLMRTSTLTRSAPARNSQSRCAPPSPPPVRRRRADARARVHRRVHRRGACAIS